MSRRLHINSLHERILTLVLGFRVQAIVRWVFGLSTISRSVRNLPAQQHRRNARRGPGTVRPGGHRPPCGIRTLTDLASGDRVQLIAAGGDVRHGELIVTGDLAGYWTAVLGGHLAEPYVRRWPTWTRLAGSIPTRRLWRPPGEPPSAGCAFGDRPGNVAGARRAGVQATVFCDPAQLDVLA